MLKSLNQAQGEDALCSKVLKVKAGHGKGKLKQAGDDENTINTVFNEWFHIYVGRLPRQFVRN